MFLTKVHDLREAGYQARLKVLQIFVDDILVSTSEILLKKKLSPREKWMMVDLILPFKPQHLIRQSRRVVRLDVPKSIPLWNPYPF